ncbi:MAG: hypothetical protein JW768_10990 [Chitinispirillaceae bacterium]|nr:hypothetical protein [Chitinispirillaceae bacterium]
MKSQKPHNTAHKQKKKPSIEKLSTYIDKEVTLIHENLEELKNFLKEHSPASDENNLNDLESNIADYYDSAGDLFHQIKLETGEEPPLKAKFYETLLLKKKNERDFPKKEGDSKQ